MTRRNKSDNTWAFDKIRDRMKGIQVPKNHTEIKVMDAQRFAWLMEQLPNARDGRRGSFNGKLDEHPLALAKTKLEAFREQFRTALKDPKSIKDKALREILMDPEKAAVVRKRLGL